MTNKLVVIGGIGQKDAYLNISIEEAIKRYFEAHPEDEIYRKLILETMFEFEFDDRFCVYDAWAKPKKI